MEGALGILTDSPVWVEPLRRELDLLGVRNFLIDLRAAPFEASAEPPLPPETIVVNRIAARTAGGDPGMVTKARDYLIWLELFGFHIINGALQQQIGASKILQAAIFSRARVLTPETAFVSKSEAPTLSNEQNSQRYLLKPNVGGFGRGIIILDETASLADTENTFGLDGAAVRQAVINPRDRMVYRVEVIDGEPLYTARVPVSPENFNYCLGRVRTPHDPDQALHGVELLSDLDSGVADQVRRIFEVAGMKIGSVEFFHDDSRDGRAVFFDINPVSTYHPDAVATLGFDPLEKLAAFLQAQTAVSPAHS